MWQALQPYRRLLFKVIAELAGLALLVGFVVGLATMPKMDITPNPKSIIGYNIKVDTKEWRNNVTTYYRTVRNGSAAKDRRGSAIGPLVAERLGRSLTLLGIAAGLAVLLGVLKGFWDFQSMRKRRIALSPMVTSAFAGVPDFWLVLMLQWGASWLWRTFDYSPFKVAWDAQAVAASMVYPVIALSLIPLAHVARTTATAMGNVYGKEYVRTARAKGLHEFLVVYKHALRNAMVQILDSLPSMMAVMLSNLLIVEYMFNYPGLTMLLKEAVAPAQRAGSATATPDMTVIILSGIGLGLIFSAFYLVVRLLRVVTDPRLKGRGAA
ncbi:MAG TPA: ABC transporter permease [Symbiobacteriaceae bacterium]|nr:ABC transporter permease [Symbiobacteriaceae bacterium]